MPFTQTKTLQQDMTSGYATVNGLPMYYEIYGAGAPLVLIHGGGSTIQTSFGRVLASFAANRQVIAVELQSHGHTPHKNRPGTFEQDADDVAALVRHLGIQQADFFGFSNGGNTAMQIAMRHPKLVRKIILASAFFKREGMQPWFWEGMQQATLSNMPEQLKEAYQKVAPEPNDLPAMFEKDKNRMLDFKDWEASSLQAIQAPALVLASDADVVQPEHTVEMFRLFPHARLCILPGAHGGYIGEVTTGMEHSKIPELTVAIIEEFLNEPLPVNN